MVDYSVDRSDNNNNRVVICTLRNNNNNNNQSFFYSSSPTKKTCSSQHFTVIQFIIIGIRRSGLTEYILRLLGWSSVACGYKVQCGNGNLYRKGHICAWSLVYLRCCVPIYIYTIMFLYELYFIIIASYLSSLLYFVKMPL